MDGTGAKRRAASELAGGQGKKQKGPVKMSFAQKMMAKMGHVQGEGLGKDGAGIVNPIEVKLRPQGAGVGAVKEMTPQAKAEAKRAAERRGETYHDSSEEEREEKRRRRRELRVREAVGGGAATPASARRKTKIRTAAQIEDEDGLVVPDIFKTLVDRTGAQAKQITSGSGIFTSAITSTSATKADKIVQHARIELEAFADAWRELKDRKNYLDFRETQIRQAVKQQKSHETRLHRLDALADDIAVLDISAKANSLSADELKKTAQALVAKYEEISDAVLEDVELFDLSEVAVAALTPIFKREINEWSPLEDATWIIPYLRKAKPFFDRAGAHALADTLLDEAHESGNMNSHREQDSLTAYDSMIFLLWFPRIRNSVTNDWNAHQPDPVLRLLDDWQNVLPVFIYRMVVDQLVTPKLSQAIKAWRPTRISKSKHSQPHQWIFPWLEYLDEYHLDPKSSGGLLAEIKRKYRSALESCDLKLGTVEGLDQWRGVSLLKGELDKELQVKMLPRLAQHLREDFEVDPTDQNITPVETILKWRRYFSVEKFSRILLSSFFPKWHDVLHQWLTAEPNYEEVGQWFTWWQGVFPDELNAESSIAAQWERGLEMMNDALELGPERVKTGLAPPPADAVNGDSVEVEAGAKAPVPEQTKAAQPEEPTSMRDILEDLCEQDGLLLMPLRKAHPESGLPLLKITASASGAGGAVVYIKGDVVWAQSKRDRSHWQPVDVFSEGVLTHLAESK